MNRAEIQRQAYEIAEEYDGDLTVRQLYYQFVARGLFMPDASDPKSGDKFYKRVVNAVARARLAGSFPFHWVVDRLRTPEESDQFTNDSSVTAALEEAGDMLRNIPYYTLGRSRWFGQPKYVVVGVEKDALSGVFKKPCEELGVGLFVFRGYSSLSSLYELMLQFEKAGDSAEVVVLYFGDHDPDGWLIPRVAEERVQQIAEVCGDVELPSIQWRRVALNMDQIERLKPPSFGAKVSSSRYESYVCEHHTNEAWELDALPPEELQRLIREAVLLEWDESIHRENVRVINAARAEFRERVLDEDWLLEKLRGE